MYNILKKVDRESNVLGYTFLKKVDICDKYAEINGNIVSVFKTGVRKTNLYKTKGFVKIDNLVSPGYIREKNTDNNLYLEVKEFNYYIPIVACIIISLAVALVLK